MKNNPLGIILALFLFQPLCGWAHNDIVRIANGVPWYDQRDSVVSAHGANIVFESGKYYMFGEFKTDSANVFKGFSCYSSPDLEHWTFERIALRPQPGGRLGPGRVGERPKVLRSHATGKYVMVMHSDDARYKDPCTAYAVADSVNGEYRFMGPLLYKGKPVKKWDIGTFTDNDMKSYLLVHHGSIYRFADDLMSLDSIMCDKVDGVGESPAMIHRDGRYYWFSSHTTSWERNDNEYVSSQSLSGPWSEPRNFAPLGTNTWNSQTTYMFPLVTGRDTVYMFMGDRWSFPRQRSAATYVWLPVKWIDGEPSLPCCMETWSPVTMADAPFRLSPLDDTAWVGRSAGDYRHYKISLDANGRIYMKGVTGSSGGYAEISIVDSKGDAVASAHVDFYSLVPQCGLRYLSPCLKSGDYSVTVTVSEMKSNWSDKRRSDYGSHGRNVVISEVGTL